MKNKIMKLKNKGFTLIELIVIIAVLGILVLVAAPKFLGHTEDAKLAQIKNDIKSYESQAIIKLAINPSLQSEWTSLTAEEMEEINNSNKAIDKKGNIVDNLVGGKNYVLDFDEVNSKLKGQFIWTSNDKLIYYDENSNIKVANNNDATNIQENDEKDKDVTPPLEYTPETDFTWIADNSGYYTAANPASKGYYKYVGTGDDTVVIPPTIYGTEMTSYYKMFFNSGSDVRKVVSKNKNVTDVSWMFYNVNTPSLDLTQFDTSNITNMGYMFSGIKATTIAGLEKFNTSNVTDMQSMFYASTISTLDLRNFDTSKVTVMSNMFNGSKATSINLSSFDTSNVTLMMSMFAGIQATKIEGLEKFNTSKVTNMMSMFSNSQLTELDLSSFDTSNATMVGSMFLNSKVTTAYARTQTDINKFNATTSKPATLTFVIK